MRESPLGPEGSPSQKTGLLAAFRRITGFGIPPAMRQGKYRGYWSGLLVSVSGYQIFQFLQFLLMHELTGSTLYLGLLGVANGVPAILLGVVGGVLADRLDKRWLIVCTQSVAGVAILILASLTLMEIVNFWHLILVGIVVSGIGSFDSPARAAFYPRLVDRTSMMSAVALNSTVWQATRIIGPACAGLIVALSASSVLTGIAAGLFVASAGHITMAVVMIVLRVSAPGDRARSPVNDLIDGISYIVGNPIVLFIILMSFIYALFGWSFIALMPVFASDILEVSEELQGMLLGASGIGATIVTVGLAMTNGSLVRQRGRMVIGGAAASGLLLAGFALSSEYIGSYALAWVLMLGLGFTQTLYTTSAMGSLQLSIPDEIRGRVLGVYAIMWGIIPLSGTQAAFLAEFVGVPFAVAIGGCVIMAFALGPALLNQKLRTLRVDPDS